MSFTDLISALRAAPADGQQLKQDEARLVAERQLVATATVHIDDVVAKGVNGTRKRAADAIAHLLAHHLNADSMAATHPDSIENPATVFDLLALTPGKPSAANAGDPKQTAAIFPQGVVPDSGILTYLLLPQVEKAVEQLIRDNLTDACRGGIRLSDRRKRLADIDKKLKTVREQRTKLAEELREAARHLEGAPEAVAKDLTPAEVAAALRAGEVVGVQS